MREGSDRGPQGLSAFPGRRVSNKTSGTLADYFRSKAREHHDWRCRSLNLCAAETLTSNLVRELLGTDFGRRYATRSGAYSGSKISDELESWCEEAACRVFRCEYANISPISGHSALLGTMIALTKPGDSVLTWSPAAGGYPLGIAHRVELSLEYFPLDESGLQIDVESARETIDRFRPELVIFGASEILFPPPLGELVDACRSVGSIVAYDASHTLGLIAGGQFQHPFGTEWTSCSAARIRPSSARIAASCSRATTNRSTEQLQNYLTRHLSSRAVITSTRRSRWERPWLRWSTSARPTRSR